MKTATSPDSKHPGNELVKSYSPRPGQVDTFVGPDGNVTPAWRLLADRLAEIDRDELEQRETQAAQILDDGTLLSAPPDQDPRLRWPLDPIPFQLSAEEFTTLGRGLSQRARLLNRIVADLLGEQRALREKVVPPALLFANPRYHRAYHGLPVSKGRYLHVCGTDVIRGPDGKWWALGDVTNAPSGLGFVLENRIALSRVHADWFHRVPVSRLSESLGILERTLARLAPRNRRNPRIVVLGHPPETARGFEDEFLARYLGYTLAVGEDLATRGGQTVLKTLGGAVPIEVILRRIDDDACDPVELRPDAIEGIAGLVESQRQNQVSIANMLGAQLAEAPALRAFLGPLARFYENEDLVLPSAATWWCGHPQELDYVIEHISELVILSAFDRSSPPIDGRTLNRTERADLAGRIRAEPERFVGQARPVTSTTPGWSGGALEPSAWSMRAFSILDEDTPRPMPGGLVRLHDDDDTLEAGLSTGGRVQDCWVHTDRPVSLPALAATEGPIVLTRGGAELPSRVAEKLYWLGRRVEAVDQRARLSRALLARVDDLGVPEDEPENATPYWLSFFDLYDEPATVATAAIRIRDDLLGSPTPTNLAGLLDLCYELARAVRDRISIDAWRLVVRTERRVAQATNRLGGPTESLRVAALLDDLVLDTAAFAGLMRESMTRTLGWRFLDMGRRVERATQTARLLESSLVEPREQERETLQFLLEVCDSSMTYRSRYLADIRLVPVIDLLAIDDTNPRAIAYQLARLNEHLDALPRESANVPLEPDRRTALGLLDAARLADPEALGQIADSGTREPLALLLQRIGEELPIVHNALNAKYLVHAELPKQFTAVDPERSAADTP